MFSSYFTCTGSKCCVVQGYDMEDAMVLNKASVERGFAHGSVYRGRVCHVSYFGNYNSCCCCGCCCMYVYFHLCSGYLVFLLVLMSQFHKHHVKINFNCLLCMLYCSCCSFITCYLSVGSVWMRFVCPSLDIYDDGDTPSPPIDNI